MENIERSTILSRALTVCLDGPSGEQSFTLVVSKRGAKRLIALQAWLYDNDDRFFPGWKLDESWTLCTVSWVVAIFCAIGIPVAKLALPSEGGYELIPDHAEYES